MRRAFAGVDLARPRPVHPPRPDGRGRVRAGRAEGHALAPAPRLRDGHLHDRRHVRARRLERRRRRHHERRHPVDDGRRRDPAHREAAGGARRAAAACSTASSCGSTCRAARSSPRRATRTSGRARSRSSRRPTAARSSGSSPARSPATPGPGSTYSPMTLVHATLEPGRPARAAVAGRLQRPRLRPRRKRHRRRRGPPDPDRAAGGPRATATR